MTRSSELRLSVYADRLARVSGQMNLSPCNGCDECGLRCEAGIQLSRDEYLDVIRYIGRTNAREVISRVLMQRKTVDLGDGVCVQLCRYRDMESGRCAVYPARPLICRLLGQVEWLPCPIDRFAPPVTTESALELMRAYADIERRTFEEWDTETELSSL